MAKSKQRKTAQETTELPLPSPHGRGTRLAITLVPIVVILLARQISLPGVDPGALTRSPLGTDQVSIIALGIMPMVSAALIVEIVAALVPRWQHLRHGGVSGRAKLQRAMDILSVVLALFQSYASATYLQPFTVHPGIGSQLRVMLTLMAGSMGLKLLADFVSTRGLVNGYGLLLGTSTILDIGYGLIVQRQPLTPLTMICLAGKIIAIAVLTWFLLQQQHKAILHSVVPLSIDGTKDDAKDVEPSENPYAAPNESSTFIDDSKEQASPSPVTLPGPVAGIVSYSTVVSVLAIPGALASMLPQSVIVASLLDDRIQVLGRLALILGLTWLLAWLFQQPRRVANVYARLGGTKESRAELEAEASNALSHARPYALIFIFGLFIIDLVTKKYARMDLVGTTGVVVIVAALLDLMREYKVSGTHKDLVPIWPEHRPYALSAAKTALEREGILVHVRDERQRLILQFGAAYLPMVICVPQADAKKAQKILDRVLRVEPDENSQKAELYAPSWNRRYAPVGNGLILGIGVLAVTTLYYSVPSYYTEKPQSVVKMNLEFVLVDDDHSITDEVKDTFPQRENEIRIEREQVSVGVGKQAVREYAVAKMMNGETLSAARMRLEKWLKSIQLPAGSRAAVGEYQEYDPDSGTNQIIGWRTYLLKGEAIIKNDDVRQAEAMPTPEHDLPGWLVRLALKPAGATRFEQVTGENIKRRFAIVLDGRVKSAPVIQTRIPGGIATITMGSADVEQQERDARYLELVLNSP